MRLISRLTKGDEGGRNVLVVANEQHLEERVAKLKILQQALDQVGVGVSKPDVVSLAANIDCSCLEPVINENVHPDKEVRTSSGSVLRSPEIWSKRSVKSTRSSANTDKSSSLERWMPREFHDLQERLQASGIDTSLYGKKDQKSLEELYYDTCIVRDCKLVTLADGSLQRMIAVVKIRLVAMDRNGSPRCLYSMGKVLGTGRKSRLLDTKDFISRKIRHGESMEDTIRNALEERLGISETLVRQHVRLAYDSERQREEKALSPGYPGLQGLYKFHEMDAWIVDPQHPDLKSIGLPEAREFIVQSDAAGDGEFDFITTRRMWAWLDAPTDLDLQGHEFKPLRPRRQTFSEHAQKSEKKKLPKALTEKPVTVSWEVKTNGVWSAWAPGVSFCGKEGEEITYTSGLDRCRATFHSTCSGTQTNLTTGTKQELRIMPQIVCLDEVCGDTSDEEFGLASIASCSTEGEVQVCQTGSKQQDFPGGAMLGSWRCVATTGLEAFLKASGANIFQRKIALSARWPSWEFKSSSGTLRFINHSAVGDLKEEMLLNGEEYQNKDGHGNVLICSSVWEPTETGGILRTTRKGAMGTYSEERRVDRDHLEFVLCSQNGPSWGRSFIRM